MLERQPTLRPTRALGALIAVVLVAVVVALVISGSGGAQGPATGAAAVVPGDALAYVNVSTDPGRPAVKQALALARRFPDFPLLSATVRTRLSGIASGSGAAVDFDTEIRPWLGHEAALAFLNTSTTTAGSLVVLDVSDHAKAQRFLAGAGIRAAATYRSKPILRTSTGTELAFLSHYLVIGQDASVRAAIDVVSGHASSLQSTSAYRRATAGEPAGRVIDAYVSADGVRRLLAPQSGVFGALGALLYEPALDGASVAITPARGVADVRVNSALDPRLAKVGGTGGARSFSPALISAVPSGTLLALDLRGLDRVAPRLLGAGSAGGVAGGLGPLLRRLGAALQAEGVNVHSDVLSLFDGETVVAIAPTTGSGASPGRPALVVIAPVRNESATRTALAKLEVPLAELFPAPGAGPGQTTVFNDRQVAGVTAHQLVLAAGLELDYAVFDGKLVISTSLQGIAGVRRHSRSLLKDPGYRATLADHPKNVTSLLFLDLSQLLSLGEQTGLTHSARYRALAPDLDKLRAIGLSSTSGEADSTAELTLQIQ